MHAWRQDNFAGVLNRPIDSETMSSTLKSAKNIRNLFNVLYSDPELLKRIQMSEWVKWQPCRGYGRLLVAVAMPTVLEILSLISDLLILRLLLVFIF
jgi:hypothetical protein